MEQSDSKFLLPQIWANQAAANLEPHTQRLNFCQAVPLRNARPHGEFKLQARIWDTLVQKVYNFLLVAI